MDYGGHKKSSSILSDEEIQDIKQLLKNRISYYEIETKYNISASFISSINTGAYFFDDKEDYPLCKYYKSNEDYDELIELLLNSPLSLSEISK